MPPEPQPIRQAQGELAPQKLNPPVFIWILIVVAILSGAFQIYTSYISSKTPENAQNQITKAAQVDTSGWKTYRNEEYGFEFKYPQDLEFSNSNPKVGQTIYIDKIETFTNTGFGDFPSGIVFSIESNKDNISLSRWINENTGRTGDLKNIVIDGRQAIYAQFIDEISGDKSLAVYISNAEKAIIIMLYSNNITVLDQILSTFRFTK